MIKYLLLVAACFSCLGLFAQKPENWTSDQLMDPALLANAISTGKELPVIICVGPGAPIPHSINVGTTGEKPALAKLKKELSKLPKDAKVLVYCGCCPFEHCPNVRPAIDALKAMNFTNYFLLNIPNNLKKDWIDKGYPVIN